MAQLKMMGVKIGVILIAAENRGGELGDVVFLGEPISVRDCGIPLLRKGILHLRHSRQANRQQQRQ